MIGTVRHALALAVLCMILAGAGLARAEGFPNGKALYGKNCAVCHGADGSVSEYGKHLKPFPARNLRAMAQWLDADEFRRIITYGLHNSEMTAKKYTLNPLEIEAVIRYIKTFTFRPKPGMGKKRYMQVCAVCHGRDGRARTGLGAKNLVYSKLDMKGLIHTIRLGRPGTMMTPKFNQISSPDIVNIAAYIYSLRYKANGQRGAMLFRKNCASCHTTPGHIRLTGNAGLQSTMNRLNANQLELRLRYGRHAHLADKSVSKLSSDNIHDIMAYIREWTSKK